MQLGAVGKDNLPCPQRESLLPIKSEKQSGSTLGNNTVRLLCFVLCIHQFPLLQSLTETSNLFCPLYTTPSIHSRTEHPCVHAHCVFSSSALGDSGLCNTIQLGSWVSWRTSRPYTAALLSSQGAAILLPFFFPLRRSTLAAECGEHKSNFQQPPQRWTGRLPWRLTPDLIHRLSIRYT